MGKQWGNKYAKIYTYLHKVTFYFIKRKQTFYLWANSPIYGEFGEIDFVTPEGLYVGL